MTRHDLERENIVRLFQLSNALQTYIDRLLKQERLTTKQFFIMIIIGSFGYEPRIGEISERFKSSHQNVKQVLIKLHKTGYVEMYKDLSDSRITRVRLSKQAEYFWLERNELDTTIMGNLFSPLQHNEMENFRNYLITLSEKITELEEELKK